MACSRYLMLGLGLLLVAPLGCSRSALSGGRRGGAGGGASSSNSSSSSSSGVGGAAPVVCNGLDQLETRSYFDQFDYKGHVPRLLASRMDGEQVSLLTRADAEPGPIDGNSELAQVTFMPWQQWSGASLGTTQGLAAATGFSVPRRADDGISFLGSFSTFATGAGTQYALNVPTTTYAEPTVISMVPYRSTFMTAGAGLFHGMGWIDNSAGVQEAHLGVASAAMWQDVVVTCMNSGMRMDGIELGGEFLAAVTVPASEPCNGMGGIQLLRFNAGGELSVIHFEPVNSLIQLQLVPRNDGAWLLWQADDGETSGPLLALPLGSAGGPAGEVVTLFGSGTIFDRVGAAEFGQGGLAIAYADALDPGPPTIVVQLFEPGGAELAGASFAPVAWPNLSEPFSLLGSPAGDSVIVAWSALMADDSVEGNTRSYVTRFDCATDL